MHRVDYRRQLRDHCVELLLWPLDAWPDSNIDECFNRPTNSFGIYNDGESSDHASLLKLAQPFTGRRETQLHPLGKIGRSNSAVILKNTDYFTVNLIHSAVYAANIPVDRILQVHLRRTLRHDGSTMNIVLLGAAIGLVGLLSPGPVNLALVQVGARRGRHTALQGAAGIMGGDSLLGLVAIGIVGIGAALPGHIFTAGQMAAALLLAILGMGLVVRPDVITASLDRMQRPGRAFFLLTSCTPTTLGSWIAMLAAMPFAADIGQLGLFTVGVLLASYIWHPALGIASAKLGDRLNDDAQRRLSRFGGTAMVALGCSLALSQLALA